jgi:hypothetical protein
MKATALSDWRISQGWFTDSGPTSDLAYQFGYGGTHSWSEGHIHFTPSRSYSRIRNSIILRRTIRPSLC